ncbi:putative oxidoreductase [Gordonia paraffinivorans NBRC 108238]|uniref:Oxidoreductase n=1 Tax=Gordonia paraffinivorans NBRC 108238 TaxID=1223543 RepID=A0ABQ0IPF0_9ACTN|nr:FAD-dependent monooxygenase [Gordonia paraffinivorans]GAC85437.1 putative oxidoreductase [Gordonia paraffinivorans NBRC 108238]
MRVVIVGAGIAGLCTAAGLESLGADVILLERAPEVRGGGSGLSLFGNGLRALGSLGLRGVVPDPPGVSPTVSGTRRADGTWLSRFSAEALADLRVVRRGDLHEALLDGLGSGVEVRTGTGVREVGARGVVLDDGTSIDGCDLIVGADGLRSRVRPAVTEDPGVSYSGYVAWRAITARPVELDGAGESMGRGQRFGIAPLPDGHVYWFATADHPRDAVPGGIDEVRQRFSRWHRSVGKVLDATDPDAVGVLPIEELARPLRSFADGRRVLVGDAAHAMTPNLGQGANQAMEDAATLTALLARPGAGVEEALREYDRLRRPRTQRIARRAAAIGRVGQWRSAPVVWLRDTAMKVVPDAVADAQMRRVQDWQPPMR